MTLPTQRQYWTWGLAFLAVEATSWLAFQHPLSERIVTAVLTAGALWLAWRRPEWLAVATVGELVVGSLGHLFYFTLGGAIISLRMILVVCLLLRTVIDLVWHRGQERPPLPTKALTIFGSWVVLAGLIGLLRGNSLNAVYTDINAFGYLAIILGWWIYLRRLPQWRPTLIALLLAGASVVAVKSWLMVLLFGQNVSFMPELYRWIRRTGVGEITLINANVYRVFFQSQVYAVLALCLTLAGWMFKRAPGWWLWPMTLAGLGAYISLSRSFWLGLGVVMAVILGVVLRTGHGKTWARLLVLLPVAGGIWLATGWALNFPRLWPAPGQPGRATLLQARLHSPGSSQASTARLNQLRPLLRAISRHPVIGSGFGTTVRYYSTDPRIRGWRTTSAFELGYLDLWLKIGLVGLGLYAWWLWTTAKRLWSTPWRWYLLLPAVALVVINATSPYLNHPLGLGWLMLSMLYAYDP